MTKSSYSQNYSGKALGVLGFALLFASPVFGQIPETFTNLKVLPKDISRQELMGSMRNFAIGLGVRCEFCHVGEPGQPLSTFDFASDEKATKQTARTMLQMVQEINTTHLAKISARSASLQVNCTTCHRNQSKPRMLEDILFVSVEEVSAESAVEKYRELRKQYYGSFTYDFSEVVLNEVAQKLIAAENYEGAVAMLNLNLEYYPESVSTFYFLGEAYAAKGDKDMAIQNFQKVLSLQPDNLRVKSRIEALQQ